MEANNKIKKNGMKKDCDSCVSDIHEEIKQHIKETSKKLQQVRESLTDKTLDSLHFE